MTSDQNDEFLSELISESSKITSNYLLSKEKLNATTADALESAFNFGYMVGYDAVIDLIKNKYGIEFVEELTRSESRN